MIKKVSLGSLPCEPLNLRIITLRTDGLVIRTKVKRPRPHPDRRTPVTETDNLTPEALRTTCTLANYLTNSPSLGRLVDLGVESNEDKVKCALLKTTLWNTLVYLLLVTRLAVPWKNRLPRLLFLRQRNLLAICPWPMKKLQ